MQPPLDLAQARLFADPFPHFHAAGALPEVFAGRVQDWLETGAPWRLTVADFYEQYEFSLLHARLPGDLACLCAAPTLTYVRQQVGGLFGADLMEAVEV